MKYFQLCQNKAHKDLELNKKDFKNLHHFDSSYGLFVTMRLDDCDHILQHTYIYIHVYTYTSEKQLISFVKIKMIYIFTTRFTVPFCYRQLFYETEDYRFDQFSIFHPFKTI